MKTLNINSQPFEFDNDLEKGFLKGSMWENLYSPYKYVVENIVPKDSLDQVIYMMQVYNFAKIELTLYLATHPDCEKALDLLKKINNERVRMCDYIEGHHNALSSGSSILDGYFKYPMPWSVK